MALPSGTILGSRGGRGGGGGGGRDADARGGDPAAGRRPGLPRRRRAVRGRRALGREAGVVAPVLGAAAGAVLQDADARRQAGGAPPGALRVLGRRGGGHGRLGPGSVSRIVAHLSTVARGSSAAERGSQVSLFAETLIVPLYVAVRRSASPAGTGQCK